MNTAGLHDAFPTRQLWTDLRKCCTAHAPNTDPDRYLATVDAMGAGVAPYVTRVGDDAMIVGRKESRRSQFRLGYASLPLGRLRWLDIVYQGLMLGSEHRIDAVCSHLAGLLHGEVDVITVNHVAIASPVFTALCNLGALVDATDMHWVLPLVHGSFDQTMAHRTGKHRGNLRRMDSKLCDHFGGQLAVRVCERPEEVDEFLGAAAAVTAASYHGGIGAGVTDTPVWRAILQTESGLGRWRGYLLLGRGVPIAYEQGVCHGGTYFLEARSFIPALRQLGPGTVLLSRLIRDLCHADINEIDFGFGDADYKRSTATRCWEESTLRLYAPRIRPRVMQLAEGWSARLTSAARAAAPMHSIKRLWRRRLGTEASDAAQQPKLPEVPQRASHG